MRLKGNNKNSLVGRYIIGVALDVMLAFVAVSFSVTTSITIGTED
jgi:heme/copper-type cytochrome/quinol oxidase subunit 4